MPSCAAAPPAQTRAFAHPDRSFDFLNQQPKKLVTITRKNSQEKTPRIETLPSLA